MANRVRDAVLDSPTARAKLKAQAKPYFRAIDRGLHLGYRKGKTGGTWVARRYLGDERYAVEALGRADDRQEANGTTVLSFHQAQDRARDRVREVEEADRLAAFGPAISVRDAVSAYIETREAKETRTKDGVGLIRDSRSRLTKHVLSDAALADKLLQALTADDLHKWRRRLAAALADGTVRRTVNDFKAALNAAIRRQGDQLPATMATTVRNGLAATSTATPVAREAQILPNADLQRIVAATAEVDAAGEWDGDLHRLVIVLAATGARFSQIQRMTVGDVQAPQNRLMVPVSRKGRGSKHSSHVAVRVTPDVIEALRPALAGRRGPDRLLLRPRWQMERVGEWRKVDRVPWHSASEMRQPWAAILEKAGLPRDLVPYALRHSSIVRGLRANLPVRLVAALHDTSTAMIEAHYTAYIVTALDELAALAAVSLITPAPTQIRSVG
ncbi:tyrosine-type recombinase/integrase [Methylobacterium sp. E-005]|uniref:tyrosine-type recombinase/integrase n=1 Tax=Methylobacterium sp. E-005 TaxID=2836549 RepID=UPI001FBA71B8|nr:tyrosine-type recombinase/integrase [Methylobacterium sp. E-005]MCJ2090357.1 tyrosine-type recombinase/integrase [Methylobacterium sp. E-005]